MKRAHAFLLLLFVLVSTYFAGAHQDYERHHVPGWLQVMGGNDPWSASEGHGYVYGPLFNLFAPLVLIEEMLPKLFFALCWFLLGAWYLRWAKRELALGEAGQRWLYAYWFCYPLFWVELVHFGHFDIVLASCCIVAIERSRAGRDSQAGAWLALGTMIKFYPLVILPVLALRRERIRWRLVRAFVATVAIVCAFAYLMWDSAFVYALTAAAEKESSHLSVFRFLRGPYSPTPDVDKYANLSMMMAIIAAAVLGWARRLPAEVYSFVMLLTLFTFYPMSNVQYLLVLFALGPMIVLRYRDVVIRRAALRWTCIAYASWITVYQLLYWLHAGFTRAPWIRMRDIAGAVSFPLSVGVLWLILQTQWRRSEPALPGFHRTPSQLPAGTPCRGEHSVALRRAGEASTKHALQRPFESTNLTDP